MFDLTLFKISLQGLKANKLRTGLTVLGVVIGIAAIIIVFSAGEAVRRTSTADHTLYVVFRR